MFGMASRKKAKEAEGVADEFKKKISELQLMILSGDMRDEDLEQTKRALEILRTRLGVKVGEDTRKKIQDDRPALA